MAVMRTTGDRRNRRSTAAVLDHSPPTRLAHLKWTLSQFPCPFNWTSTMTYRPREQANLQT